MFRADTVQSCSTDFRAYKTRFVVFVFTRSTLTVDTQASDEGTHFLVPWLQRAILYDCRIKPRVGVFFCYFHFGLLSKLPQL